MTHSITTSIRLTPELRQELDQIAHLLHRGRNWIIVQALQAYLAKQSPRLLAEEARRQSLRASKSTKEDELWEHNADTSDWDS